VTKIIETEQYHYKPVQNKTIQVHCPTNPWNMCDLKSYIIPDKQSHFDNIPLSAVPSDASTMYQTEPEEFQVTSVHYRTSFVPLVYCTYSFGCRVLNLESLFLETQFGQSCRVAHFSS
jgi:hypothetical protein